MTWLINIHINAHKHTLRLARARGPLLGSMVQNNRKTFSVINTLLLQPVEKWRLHSINVLNLLEIIDFVGKTEGESGRVRQWKVERYGEEDMEMEPKRRMKTNKGGGGETDSTNKVVVARL